MAIKIRRGTDTERLTVVLEEGEIAYTTDTKKFYIGDGTTTGGNEIPAGFTPPDGLLQTALELSNTLQSIQDQNSNTSALQIGTDNIGLAADTTATTQTTAVIQATDTNSGIAIVPNGTGAITRLVPGEGLNGGNARGQYATDFGVPQDNYNENIASGDYSFLAGYSGKATGLGSVSFGHNRNYATGDYSFASGVQNVASGQGAIAMGNSNDATYRGAVALGGYLLGNVSSNFGTFTVGENNTASGRYSSVSGGQSNTASTNNHATVVGGYLNSSTGQYSVSGGYSNVASGQGAVALGYDNTASAIYSVAMGYKANASGNYGIALCREAKAQADRSVAIGADTIASGVRSIALGGYLNQAQGGSSCAIGSQSISSGDTSFCYGFQGKSYLYCSSSASSGRFSANGDAQQSLLVARKQDTLTTGATTTLSLDGTGTTNLIIPDGNNRVWNVTIKYTAVVTSITGTATGVSVGDCKNEVLTIGFKKIGGTSSVVGSLNTVSTNEDLSMSTASFGVTAGASQEMKLDFTAPTFLGGGSVTTRVVAKVELTEVAF